MFYHFISPFSHSFQPLTVRGQLSCWATSSFKNTASSSSLISRMACALLFLRPNSSRLCLCRIKPSAISSIAGLFIGVVPFHCFKSFLHLLFPIRMLINIFLVYHLLSFFSSFDCIVNIFIHAKVNSPTFKGYGRPILVTIFANTRHASGRIAIYLSFESRLYRR